MSAPEGALGAQDGEAFDVAIVGYGPVGQSLAAMLGQAGYRVGVFERWPGLYPLPRACVVDHEIMRVLQSIDVADRFSQLAVPTAGEYVWLNASGQTLYHFKYPRDGVSGWPARHLMYQPDLEAELDRRVRQLPGVQVNQGWEAVDFSDGPDGAELIVARRDVDASGHIDEAGPAAHPPATRPIRARFVVGADGAHSFVRRAARMDWDDLGFRADWLVVDFRPHDPARVLDMPEAGQICDPARPITLMRHMGKKHVRWEMMLLPGETADEVTQPERVWSMIQRWVGPGDGVIDRAAVYTFRSGLAREWVRGNALLVGDAAHLMPPFLGQGLCSGLRDAMSAFWRLDLVLRGVAAPAVFKDFERERQAHVGTVIERAVALGKVVCITDPGEAARRDTAILTGTAPRIPPFPGLCSGVLHRQADGSVAGPAGELALQARVQIDLDSGPRVGRFDDLLGVGWRVITFDAAIAGDMSPAHQAFAGQIGLRFVTLASDTGNVDIDGAYRRWLDGLGVAAVIVRPDFYIYAAPSSAGDMPALIDELMHQLPTSKDLPR